METASKTRVNLIIGSGEIGTSLYEVLKEKHDTYIRDINPTETPKPDILHICFPPSPTFVDDVRGYIEEYDPELVIVYSSTPIGTCEQIGDNIVHSPVEGRHPKLAEGFETFPRWVGCKDGKALSQACSLWQTMVETIRPVDSASVTEMLKMRSTAKYGVNLVWADYEKQLTDAVGTDFNAVKVYDFDYNYLYEKTGWPQFSRYILDPPNGTIGGHCVVPNAELLDEQYPHEMLKMIIKMKKEK